jgi:hypothetical protein
LALTAVSLPRTYPTLPLDGQSRVAAEEDHFEKQQSRSKIVAAQLDAVVNVMRDFWETISFRGGIGGGNFFWRTYAVCLLDREDQN